MHICPYCGAQMIETGAEELEEFWDGPVLMEGCMVEIECEGCGATTWIDESSV